MASVKLLSVLVLFVVGTNAQFQLPHGHDLKDMVDQGFNLFDKNNDGVMTIDEMVFITDGEDVDHDGNITLTEYMQYFNIPIEVAEPIFNVYDYDKDGVIPNAHPQSYFDLIDSNSDGEVSLHEYEHFMTGFLQCVFEGGSHGHGPDCRQR